MIYPTVYFFNAPYRGPKSRIEINKIFTSIIYDIATVYDEAAMQEEQVPKNLSYCTENRGELGIDLDTAGLVNGTDNYSYIGTHTMGKKINNLMFKAEEILKNL